VVAMGTSIVRDDLIPTEVVLVVVVAKVVLFDKSLAQKEEEEESCVHGEEHGGNDEDVLELESLIHVDMTRAEFSRRKERAAGVSTRS